MPDAPDTAGTAAPLRVVVLGAGGIGGYFGGVLARAGQDVTLLARGEHLAAIQAHGLELRTPAEEAGATTAARVRVRATSDPAALPDADLVLVAVKSYSLHEVAPAAARLAARGATVLPLLNGVDAADRLAEAGVPRAALLGGVTVISAARVAPGVVERRSAFQRVVVGRFAAAAAPPADDPLGDRRVADIVRAFHDAGVEARVSPRIDVELWNKLAFLASMAAACGLARQDVGTVRRAPLGRLLIERAVAEIAAVGRAHGVALDPDVTAQTVAAIDALPDAMRPSFLLDLAHGGPTELDVLSGAVGRLGRQYGVPTPVHDTAVAALGAATNVVAP
ncbi:2-dehydropantoate 2-reductase [Gemmatimonadetes bacterium T265]|nr:2-dehydropantoate 2-reductase [Gemmatimonadetes bacterium T265]